MRFIHMIVFAILLVFIQTSILAAPTAVLNVPAEGDHFYWFTYKGIDGASITTAPRRFKDKSTVAELPIVKDAVVSSTLFVYDFKTGNEAIFPIKAKTADSTKIDIKGSDFSNIRRIGIVISSSEKKERAAAAVVILQTGTLKQTQVVDPSSAGIAYFNDIPSGTAKIAVNYGAGKTSTQDIEITLDRQDAIPMIEVPVVGDIETIQAAAESTTETTPATGGSIRAGSPQKSLPEPRSSATGFGTALFGLILLAGLVYLAYRFFINKGVAVKSLLKQAGIDIPEEKSQTPIENAPQQVVVDPSVCPFCGGKKDPVTGACACSVTPGGSVGVPQAGAGTEPRLVANAGAYTGSIFILGSGTVIIGRDESNTIALPLDSAVSRRHSRIENVGGAYTIYDEGSSNGTFVNGAKITERSLHSGDEIQVGSTRLRFDA
ncbi:MAG: FHA domain-containing protein [Armatimonadota bacterium]